jgi:hypothetical protein
MHPLPSTQPFRYAWPAVDTVVFPNGRGHLVRFHGALQGLARHHHSVYGFLFHLCAGLSYVNIHMPLLNAYPFTRCAFAHKHHFVLERLLW